MPGCKGQVTKFVYHFVLFLMSCLITHEKQLEASLQERTQTSGVGNCGAVDSF